MTIGIALIGAGAVARDHVAALHRLDGVRVLHVVDLDPARARAVAALAGGAVWATTPDEALADARVTAVDVCTPPDSHAVFAIAAAERGKAVHIEKPVAPTMPEAEAMLATASRHGVPFMVGQTTRFQPVHRELAAAIADGAVGRVRALHTSWYAGHVWQGGWNAWQLDPARCGGHLVQNGVHAIDLAVWLLGATPVRVFARGLPTFAPRMPTPDTFHVTIRFDDDSLALLEWSYALRNRGEQLRRIVAIGERGSLHHSSEYEPALTSDAVRLPPPSTDDAMFRQLSHWVAVLRGEEEPIVRPDEVRATLAAALAGRRSLETGRAVTLREVTGD
jgi:predicted dehydrogenase